MIGLMLALRFLHVCGGVFWVGALFTLTFFVMPAAVVDGPAGQRFLRRLALERGLTPAMVIAGSVTVVAGLGLAWIDSGGFRWGWFASGTGGTLAFGGLSGIGALVFGLRAAGLVRKLDRLVAATEAAGGPPNPAQLAEAQALGARLRRSSRSAALHGAIALVCMAVARYLPF